MAMYSQLFADTVVGLIQVDSINFRLLVNAIQLYILPVQFTSHVFCNPLQVSQHIRHGPIWSESTHR